MSEHAVILLHEGPKVLFVQRAATKKKMPNVWSFASGTIEPGETPENTVKREAKEELGLDVEIEKRLNEIHLPHADAVLYFVLCHNKSHQPIIFDSAEIQKYQFSALPDFFNKFTDDQIDHAPRYLRDHPEIWNSWL